MVLGAVFRLDEAGHDLGFRCNTNPRTCISSLPTDIRFVSRVPSSICFSVYSIAYSVACVVV
jgi:hypothetical protein